MPPLSRLDLPGVIASIRTLYGVIEQPPAAPWRPPAWLIDQYRKTTAGEEALTEYKESWVVREGHYWLIDEAAHREFARPAPAHREIIAAPGEPELRVEAFFHGGREGPMKADESRIRCPEGIQFAFDRIERTPNTLDAHRLVGLAERQGVQDAVVEALFRAYVTEGRDISNRQTLLDVVGGAGLDRHGAEAVLNSDDGLEAVKEADTQARRFGVDSVPFFIFNGTLTLSGAQQPGACLEALRQAAISSGCRAAPSRSST
jgi:predicted DsbA family dithiol-disulfide isomerase